MKLTQQNFASNFQIRKIQAEFPIKSAKFSEIQINSLTQQKFSSTNSLFRQFTITELPKNVEEKPCSMYVADCSEVMSKMRQFVVVTQPSNCHICYDKTAHNFGFLFT